MFLRGSLLASGMESIGPSWTRRAARTGTTRFREGTVRTGDVRHIATEIEVRAKHAAAASRPSRHAAPGGWTSDDACCQAVPVSAERLAFTCAPVDMRQPRCWLIAGDNTAR